MSSKETDFRVGKFDDGKEFKIEPSILTKHAIVLGATGSGKTVLCKAIIEEAALNGIPVLAIDPKGDISCLAISSQDYSFRPWSDIEADSLRRPREEYAEELRHLYLEKTAASGITSQHVKEFMEKVEVRTFTPKSSAGIPVSISPKLDAPPQFSRWIDEEPSTAADLLDISVTSLLNIIRPGRSDEENRAVSYLSSILEHEWRGGRGVDLNGLIELVQRPPFDRMGNLSLDQIFPEKERIRLAGDINLFNVHPRLRPWMHGTPVDFDQIFQTTPKTLVNVVDLRGIQSQEERSFFVEMLLQQLYNWIMKQKGVQSLRFLLYFDEVMGYCPPVREPPSKKVLLLLIKQARAFGLGLILATQNPIDLDYKVISNANVRFIGRLATERDIERVKVGLDLPGEAAQTISTLSKSQFFYQIFDPRSGGTVSPRWLMTYHRGPLKEEEISVLMKNLKEDMSLPSVRAGLTPAELGKEVQKPIILSSLSLLEPLQTFGPLEFERGASLRNARTMKITKLDERILLYPIYRISTSIPGSHYAGASFEYSEDFYAESAGLQAMSFATKGLNPIELQKESIEHTGATESIDSWLKDQERIMMDALLAQARIKVREKIMEDERAVHTKFDVRIREAGDKLDTLKREIESKQSQIEGLKREINQAEGEIRRRKGRKEPTAKLTQQILSRRTRIAEIKQAVIRDERAYASLESERKELDRGISNQLSKLSTRAEEALSNLANEGSSKQIGWLAKRNYQGTVLVNGKQHQVNWESFSGRPVWKACHKCQKELQEGLACDCGNLCCKLHVMVCSRCARETCSLDSWNCAVCGKPFCNHHQSLACSECNKLVCENDAGRNRCSCGKIVCEDHNPRCYICRKIYCSEHSLLCYRCSMRVGSEHSGRCHVCGKPYCTLHLDRCQRCKEDTCGDCVGKRPILGFLGNMLCKNCAAE